MFSNRKTAISLKKGSGSFLFSYKVFHFHPTELLEIPRKIW